MSTRQNSTQQDREHWLTQFAQADCSAIAFCRQHGLGYQSFLKGRKAAQELSEQPSTSSRRRVPPPKSIPPSGEQIELTFPSGLTLRIQSHTSTQP